LSGHATWGSSGSRPSPLWSNASGARSSIEFAASFEPGWRTCARPFPASELRGLPLRFLLDVDLCRRRRRSAHSRVANMPRAPQRRRHQRARSMLMSAAVTLIKSANLS
jgi:hypothetical protein